MKKFYKNVSCMAMVMLIGGMAALTGCGASEEPAAQVEAVSEERTVETVETQNVQSQTVEATTTEAEETKEEKTETAEPETVASTTEQEETKEEKTETEPKQEETVLPDENTTGNAVAEGSVSESDFAAIVKGVTIPLLGDMRNYAASLGDPDDFGSAKSCTEAGEDKVYTYGETVIYTYVTNGADAISLIEITGGDYLPSGIHIGSTKEEVIAAYGSGYTEDGTELLYEMGTKTIGLQMTDNQVSFIELFGQ